MSNDHATKVGNSLFPQVTINISLNKCTIDTNFNIQKNMAKNNLFSQHINPVYVGKNDAFPLIPLGFSRSFVYLLMQDYGKCRYPWKAC